MSEGPPSTFPAPKPQDLTLLARKIQQNDNEFLRDEIKKNPRLLASSTDNPTVLQEGFRYNALHVAARFGNSEAVRIILSTVNGVSFMKSLYPDDSQHTRDGRTKFLTDMYLNAPDKGTLETPLHFACKFNFHHVAKILLGHPLCDTTLKNKEGCTAKDIVGSRSSKLNEGNGERIRRLFEETLIVPIWRDLTNDSAPVVGRPVNPKYLGEYTPPPFTALYGDIVLAHFGPVDISSVPKSTFGTRREIRAYVGPTDEESAQIFYGTLKGTATLTYGSQTPPFQSSPSFQHSPARGNQGDVLPSLPKTPTRNLLRKTIHGTPTRFLGCETPERRSRDDNSTPPPITPKKRHSALLSPTEFEYTPKTLSLLLASPGRGGGCSTPPNMLEDRKIRLRDPEKGIERVARKYAAEYNLPWNEYWVFLGEFANLSSDEGLVLLEDHLYRAREYEIANEQQKRRSKTVQDLTPFTAMCDELEKLNLGSGSTPRPKKVKEAGGDWWSRAVGSGKSSRKTPNVDVVSQRDKKLFVNKLQNGNGTLRFEQKANSTTQEKIKMGIRKLFPKFDDSNDAFSDSSSDSVDSDSDDDGSGRSSWKTPFSSFPSSSASSSDSEYFEDCDTFSLYINGTQPSKEDYQALHAISSVAEDIPVDKFPHIIGWYNALKASSVKKK